MVTTGEGPAVQHGAVPVPPTLARRWPWLLGGGAGVAALGPALGPGSLLSLDLVVLPRVPVPTGIWGLGPDLPRRVPYGAALAWASEVVGGPAAGKSFLLLAVAAAVAGAARLVGDQSVAVRAGAGLLYGLSPFLLTRVGAGHLGLVAAYAVLPWALPALLRPAACRRRAVLWAAALGLTGVAGGVLALALGAVGLAADRSRRALLTAAGVVVAQLPWAVPGAVVVVAGAGAEAAPARAFATRVDGLAGVLGLPAGHGFWREASQVGGEPGAGVAVLGAVLLVLAAAGVSRLPAGWRHRALVAAAAGIALAAATAVPGVDALYERVTDVPVFAPAREGHRWLALFLVALAPAAALGAAHLGGRLVTAVPAALALALAGPSLWGLDGRLDPVDLPGGWAEAKAAVDARPGPVVALPWHQYLDIDAAGGRRVLHPLPDYLGGDVLTASDPELGRPRRERADAREPVVDRLLARAEEGARVSGELAGAGFRWVAVLHEVDFERYASLADDPGLERVVTDPSVDLYRVRAWRGPAVDRRGRSVDVEPTVAPLASVASDEVTTWHRPAASGWLRGWRAAHSTPHGTLRVPAGDAPVWYWPAAVVLFADLCTVLLVGALLMHRRVGTVAGGTANDTQYGRGS